MNSETIDRRLIMRVLKLWKGMAREDRFPRRSQIDPNMFGQDWANCFIVDLDPNFSGSRLAFVGGTVRDPAWPPLDRQCVGDCEEGTVIQLAASRIPSLLARRAPISFGGQAMHGESPILYRSILLPL